MDGSYPVLSVFYWALDNLYYPFELELSSCDKSETLLDKCFRTVSPSADELLLFASSECWVDPMVFSVVLDVNLYLC